MNRPLSGATFVVTRATDQAATLTAALVELGATVVELPVIAITDPADGGAALEAAVRGLRTYDWVVVTSPNGSHRLVDAISSQDPTPGGSDCPRFAAIGPRTAAPLLEAGMVVDLVPEPSVAEALLGAFPAPPSGGRVLVARAEVARPVLPDGLRAAGWEVDVVAAYRNVAPHADPDLVARARGADAVTFTSESTVRRYVDLVGRSMPPDAVCIGPISAAAARDMGFRVTEADPCSLAGLVAAACTLSGS
ncbi:MAG: uroporphyrinogen-III synthase [Actinobacteria bacterium]|nr:uroporphyrinogen-III synthase [Actinomycetota bacterium]MBT3687214.1 uroporphyrinogen-III synthase [Actinomycetota bacterium]MBT4037949.1 uroporphyrinogen-III synthase [Actinomycetota bacterium]MBT4279926.1 uroporphyrinogen-III synthase [Actinomycetota bacterium]MBT4342800.1 uroporphyrinogen-III synthase [Actinomycetota bacterium]